MRLLFLTGAFCLATSLAAAAAEPPNARSAYVERRGLIEADTRCGLFRADIRAALQVSTAQARGALLRAGWTNSRMRELERAVVAAAGARPCNDARTLAAAATARASVSGWVNAGSMEFPGWERTWLARRVVRADGWRLSQRIEAPLPAMFGVRDRNSAQQLTLALPLARGQAAPASVRLIIRDVSRARAVEIALPQRIAQGLAAGAPSPDAAQAVPSMRVIERIAGGSQAVFTFPDAAFRDLLALDPRESIELRLETGRVSQSLFVEVGDIAAARAFLTIR